MATRVINTYIGSNAIYNLSSTNIYKVGEAFNIPYSCVIQSIDFFVGVFTGNPGDSYVELWACTGTLGASAVGTGSPLATSDSVSQGAIGGSGPAQINYVFSGVNAVSLPAGNYVFTVTATTMNGSDVFRVYADTAPTAFTGNTVEYKAVTAWNPRGTFDTPFVLYGYKTPFSPFPSTQNL